MPKSKISCLPATIQDELNERLSQNDDFQATLAWLNALPAVEAMLAERFRSQPINNWNLILWRKTGFPAWLKRHERLERLRQLDRFAAEYAQTNHTALAEGVAALANAKLLELLELVDDDAAAEAADPGTDGGDPGQAAAGTTAEGAGMPVSNEIKRQLAIDQLAKIATTLRALRAVEQGAERLKQNEKRLKLAEERLAYQRDFSQREVVDIGVKLLHDARAKEIEADSAVSYEQRIEILGQHIFGDLWTPRNIPGVVSLTPEQFAALKTEDEPAAAPKEDGGSTKPRLKAERAGREAGDGHQTPILKPMNTDKIRRPTRPPQCYGGWKSEGQMKSEIRESGFDLRFGGFTGTKRYTRMPTAPETHGRDARATMDVPGKCESCRTKLR